MVPQEPGPAGHQGEEAAGAAMDLVIKLGAVRALAYVSMAALKRYTSGSVSQRHPARSAGLDDARAEPEPQ